MIDEIAFKYLGNSVKPYLKNFSGVKSQLIKSDIRISLHEYVCRMVFYSVLAFIFSLPFLSLVFGLMLGFARISSVALAFTLAISISLILTTAVFAGMYYYPSMKVSDRKKRIDNALPFGTIYMSSVASSGAPPANIFKIISNFGEFGELSDECAKIYNDTEIFGMDIKTAIQKAAERAPSEGFKDLLWGMLTIITTGGNLANYLREKSKAYMSDYRRRLNEYSQQLSLFIEMYITLIIVGSIFFLILSAVMAAISTSPMIISVQFFVIFVFLPLVSIGFVIFMKGMSPSEH